MVVCEVSMTVGQEDASRQLNRRHCQTPLQIRYLSHSTPNRLLRTGPVFPQRTGHIVKGHSPGCNPHMGLVTTDKTGNNIKAACKKAAHNCWCRERDSNPHGHKGPGDFKSPLSTCSNIPAAHRNYITFHRARQCPFAVNGYRPALCPGT